MDDGNLTLLLQLINGVDQSFDLLEKAYNNSEKAEFEFYKTTLLDFQNKLEYMLKNVA